MLSPSRLGLAMAAAALSALVILLAASPRDAAAHPLDNFSINHYSRIDVSETGIELFRVIDMAEIPALQERQAIDTDDDGDVSPAEAETWAATTTAALPKNITLRVNGSEVTLAPGVHALTFPEGQGGLLLVRFEASYTAPLPEGWEDGATSVEYEDRNYAERKGWSEVVVRGGPGVTLASSDVPGESVSLELTSYPGFASTEPLEVRTANFSFEPGAGAPLPADTPHEARAVRGNPDSNLSRFADLIGRDDLGFGVVALMLLAAVGFGALHALSPGHGKTVVAAYLVGSRGTAWHAVLLGLVVTATHTSTVYLLGFVTLYFSDYILPEDLYPVLTGASGALIALMGAALFVGRIRSSGLAADAVEWTRGRLASERGAIDFGHTTRPAVADGEPHDHAHHGDASEHAHAVGEEHEHEHEHDHDYADENEHRHGLFNRAHSHTIPGADGEPVTIRSLIGLGIFGGLLPCPSAIVVMLSAIALHRVALGLLLIVAFSVGLAGVLTGIGFAMVYARTIGQRLPWTQRFIDRANHGGAAALAVRVFPVLAAAAVTAAGLVIMSRAL